MASKTDLRILQVEVSKVSPQVTPERVRLDIELSILETLMEIRDKLNEPEPL